MPLLITYLSFVCPALHHFNAMETIVLKTKFFETTVDYKALGCGF